MPSPDYSAPAQLPAGRWYVESAGRTAAFSVLVAVIVSAGTFGADWFFFQAGESPTVMMFASDLFAGLVSGLLVFSALKQVAERTRAVRERLNIVAQMNHHVRNALQVISYSTYSSADQREMKCIREAAERIEWALSEILGNVKPATLFHKHEPRQPLE